MHFFIVATGTGLIRRVSDYSELDALLSAGSGNGLLSDGRGRGAPLVDGTGGGGRVLDSKQSRTADLGGGRGGEGRSEAPV